MLIIIGDIYYTIQHAYNQTDNLVCLRHACNQGNTDNIDSVQGCRGPV